jgi:hypothetical protein
MTADLTPTPTRLALLADVAAGHVYRDELAAARPSYIDAGLRDPRNGTCTSTIRALYRRDLVEPGEHCAGRFSTWQLTSAGRTMLDRMGGDK